jgi:hypothetical protein
VKAAESIPALSPWCDIRSQGAVINGTTPIDSAVQACINIVDSVYGGTGIVLLPCVRQNSTGPGCFLQDSAALTGPSAGMVKFELQGGLQVGSTLVGYGWQSWFGDAGGAPQQFQTGTVPAAIFGPQCFGTLGAAITSANTATTITPTFTGNAYSGGPACSIANLPTQSAFTIAATGSVTATAVSTYESYYGLSEEVLTLSTPLRVPPGEIVSVSGCSNSALNVSNITVDASDYTANTITFFRTTITNASATGCTATGFNEDAFESARILCSNGAGGTFNGVTYNSCGTGQVTIMTSHTHLSTDSWGEVAAGPSFNTYGSQTWDGLTFLQPAGAAFWAEGSTNLVMNNISTQASQNMTSAATVLSANYISQIHEGFFQVAQANSSPCLSGGCLQPSYPYALYCPSDAPVGGYYSATVGGCDRTIIDRGSWFAGAVKLGDGVNQLTGLPHVIDADFEEVFGPIFMTDNRRSISAPNCLSLIHVNTQDNISQLAQPLVGYTDGNLQPTGCVQTDSAALYGNPLTNRYFNGNLTDILTQQAIRAFPTNATAASGVYNEGNLLAGEIENEGASFSPSILPYGSLAMTYTPYTVANWASLCTTAGDCTITTIPGPDGPNGKMVAAEMDTTSVGANIRIGQWTGATYPGDHFLIWSWIRPGLNEAATFGLVGGVIGNGNSFYINMENGSTFAPTSNNGNFDANCTPGAFATGLYSNGWSPEVAICTIATGGSSADNVDFNLAATNGGSGTAGNQFAEPGFAFIPGPNNPACTAAGTCNLSADQIEEARRDQYHGFVPPGMNAGAAATGETVSANGYTVNGTPLNAPSETYSASASGSITLPSADRAEATYVLSGNVTASIGAGTGGGKVTVFICQPASGGPYTWTWPASWKGGATVGTTASTCSEQTGTYIAGLGDWHGDAGSTNVPQ